MPASLAKLSRATACDEPGPVTGVVSSPGFAFARATNSASVLMPEEAGTTNRLGEVAMRAIGARLSRFQPSRGSLSGLTTVAVELASSV